MLQGMLKEHFQIPCLFDPTEPVPTLLWDLSNNSYSLDSLCLQLP